MRINPYLILYTDRVLLKGMALTVSEEGMWWPGRNWEAFHCALLGGAWWAIYSPWGHKELDMAE